MNRRARSRETQWLKSWLGGLTALAPLGCDNTIDDGACGSQAAGTANLAVWWGTPTPDSSGGGAASAAPENAEDRALAGLIEEYRICNPNVTPQPDQSPNKAALMAKLDNLLLDPSLAELAELPDVVQLNAGETALQYAACDGGTEGAIAPVLDVRDTQPPLRDPWASPDVGSVPSTTPFGNALADGAVWFQYHDTPEQGREHGALPREPWVYADKANWIQKYISCRAAQGRRYWVTPIGIHHLNRLYYNIAAVRTALGLAPDEDPKAQLQGLSLAEWLALMSRPHPNGQPWFALPNDPASGWAISLLAAENVKLSLKLAAGKVSTTKAAAEAAAEAVEVMNVMQVIVDVSQVWRQTWSVKESMAAVERGSAVFTVMGDWALPDVDQRQVGMVEFPGTQHALVYTIDGFVSVNKHRVSGTAGATWQAEAWMRTVSDPEVATRFAAEKGAQAIERWLTTTVTTCAENAYAKDRDCWVIPALSMRNQRCDASETLLAWAAHPSANREKAIAGLTSCESDSPATDAPAQLEALPERTIEGEKLEPWEHR